MRRSIRMWKKSGAAVLALVLSLALTMQAAASPLDWYKNKTEGKNQTQTESGGSKAPVEEPKTGQGGSPAPVETSQSAFQYVKGSIASPGAGGLEVGMAAIPAGWSISTQDLGISTESIACPNAVVVTVTSPDGKCVLTYVSTRIFKENHVSFSGMTVDSTDNSYDVGEAAHMLNYRDADASCDLMAQVLYGGEPVFLHENALAPDMRSQLETLQKDYENTIINGTGLYGKIIGDSSTQLLWTDVTLAGRTYQSGKQKIQMLVCVDGFELFKDMSIGQYQSGMRTINWCMDAVFGMKADADVFDQYQEVFDVFSRYTGVSQEYIKMRSDISQELILARLLAQNGQPQKTQEELEARYDEIFDSTIRSGATYAFYDSFLAFLQNQAAGSNTR